MMVMYLILEIWRVTKNKVAKYKTKHKRKKNSLGEYERPVKLIAIGTGIAVGSHLFSKALSKD